MAFSTTVVRILIASPSDVAVERDALTEVISTWNIAHARSYGITLSAVRWETHATPELGGRPQAIINRQLVDECDVVLGIFWTRLGTPTGVAASGTIEEIERLRAQGKHVLLYFSDAPASPDLDRGQLARLEKYKADIGGEGLFDTYRDVSELREKVNRHITEIARRFVGSRSINMILGALLGMISSTEFDDTTLTALVARLHCREVLVLRDLFYVAGRRAVAFSPKRALSLGEQCRRLFFLSDQAVKKESALSKQGASELFQLTAQPYVDQFWPELRPELDMESYFDPNLVESRITGPARRALGYEG